MLSPKKMKVLETLVTCGTKKETIEKCGIAPATLDKYLRDPEFASLFQELRIEGLKENYRFVQANVRDAIDRLVEMVNAETGDISDTVRLNAINSLLQYSFKITEQMDILERLEILEGKVKENG
ncbi:hypothetical protein SAMN04487884_1162 [Butyrivibrio fibrisolvens]|uniref:Homeodomain phBC6A51-type domain-containing protein n=1 Tax=Butyrivibrio fibrisolvens TaxID=831 RepID=A0A1H9TT60_BUTFI|nr:hypothetical protein [Butyrivibrio fibrisolvens]SES00224.1 hypothetical protein SAMN04487884_1162 [Butyrivibrio fibrisolvens]